MERAHRGQRPALESDEPAGDDGDAMSGIDEDIGGEGHSGPLRLLLWRGRTR